MTPPRKSAPAKSRARSPGAAPAIEFTASDIVMRRVDELKPFPNNPKIHTPEQIDSIAANISEFGFDQPVLIDEEDTILKGHGRCLAAPKAGREMVPTIARAGLTPAQKWAIVISDNVLPAMTGLDQRLLKVGIAYLTKVDYPLQLTGLDGIRLATFGVAAAAGAAPNDIPDLAPATSRPGDVWMMGSHRLVCGDATNEKIRAKLFGDDEPKVMLTDPPYRTETEGGDFYRRGNSKKIGEANLGTFEVDQLVELLDTNIIFTSKDLLADYLDLVREQKLTWDVAVLHRDAAVPNHNNHLMSDLDYIVLAGKIAPKRGLEHSDYSKLFSTGHWDRPVPWAKPVELISRLMRLYTVAGDLVFEPYCGSGTTIIAAETLGRKCLAVELNPAYADLSVRRWQKFSTKEAVLQGTRKTFEQVVKERSRKAV